MFYLIIFFIFLLGLIVGSFLNCLIWRLHKKESIMGRSYCPKCEKQIVWYDNIPVLSFIFLRGRCRQCGEKISFQYPAVELAAGVFFVLAFVVNARNFIGYQPDFGFFLENYFLIFTSKNFLFLVLLDWFIIAVMIVVFVYDLRWYLILDIITLPACLVVLAMNLMLGIHWQNLLVSGIIGSSFFLIQFVISRGKWIGGGDIRLGLLMGMALGWPMVLLAIFLAYLIGSVIGLALILTGKKKWGSQIPLGVFLSLSVIIVLFWGEKILFWYIDFLNIG